MDRELLPDGKQKFSFLFEEVKVVGAAYKADIDHRELNGNENSVSMEDRRIARWKGDVQSFVVSDAESFRGILERFVRYSSEYELALEYDPEIESIVCVSKIGKHRELVKGAEELLEQTALIESFDKATKGLTQ